MDNLEIEIALDDVAKAYRAYCKAVENLGEKLSSDNRVRNHPERQSWNNSIQTLAPSFGEWDRGFRRVRSQVEKASK